MGKPQVAVEEPVEGHSIAVVGVVAIHCDCQRVAEKATEKAAVAVVTVAEATE